MPVSSGQASALPLAAVTVMQAIEAGAQQLEAAGVAFGHGTDNAFDEAVWLVLWQLGLPLDDLDSVAHHAISQTQQTAIAALFETRISTRQPAAYLTREAWLQGLAFYVDERAIVPRSLIAQVLADGLIDPWLGEPTRNVLDLCTGNGSLAVLAALAWPQVRVDASDISADALAVAAINVLRHGLAERITLVESDGFAALPVPPGGYDLLLCNPPYVNADSMARLPAEFLAEPRLALDGNAAGGRDGMDFIRQLIRQAPQHMSQHAVLVLEIGHEQAHFEAAFPALEVVWLETSTTEQQVLLVTAQTLRHFSQS